MRLYKTDHDTPRQSVGKAARLALWNDLHARASTLLGTLQRDQQIDDVTRLANAVWLATAPETTPARLKVESWRHGNDAEVARWALMTLKHHPRHKPLPYARELEPFARQQAADDWMPALPELEMYPAE